MITEFIYNKLFDYQNLEQGLFSPSFLAKCALISALGAAALYSYATLSCLFLGASLWCAFSAFTELGPPESMIPTGFLAKISSKGVLNGRTSE